MDNSTFLQEQIDEGRFFLDFISQNDINTGEIIAQEAVIWYTADDDRIISAASFLSNHEGDADVTKLDIWLMDEVCKILKNMGPASVKPVLLNISNQTIQDPYCLYDMILSLKNYGIGADRLRIVLPEKRSDDSDYRREKGITFLKLNKLIVTDRSRQESVNFNEDR